MPSCDSCQFWDRENVDGFEYADCRRYPPQIFERQGNSTSNPGERCPGTDSMEWCGEYKKREDPN